MDVNNPLKMVCILILIHSHLSSNKKVRCLLTEMGTFINFINKNQGFHPKNRMSPATNGISSTGVQKPRFNGWPETTKPWNGWPLYGMSQRVAHDINHIEVDLKPHRNGSTEIYTGKNMEKTWPRMVGFHHSSVSRLGLGTPTWVNQILVWVKVNPYCSLQNQQVLLSGNQLRQCKITLPPWKFFMGNSSPN